MHNIYILCVVFIQNHSLLKTRRPHGLLFRLGVAQPCSPVGVCHSMRMTCRYDIPSVFHFFPAFRMNVSGQQT